MAALFSYGAVFFLILLLAGCGSGSGVIRSTFGELLPGRPDVSDYASQLPYASLDISINGRGGLIVLAEYSGAQAYFQASSRETIVLRHGYLVQTAGLDANLLMTRLLGDEEATATTADYMPPWQRAEAGQPMTYTVQRQWRDEDGVLHAGTAAATLKCDEQAIPVELPLATVDLQRCDETLVWADGAETHSVLWRDPQERMLWRVSTVPWPGGPEVAWRVARPWW